MLLDDTVRLKDENPLIGIILIGVTTLSSRIKAEYDTYRAFSCLDSDSRTLRTVDHGTLLVDLRSGIGSITISDYTGGLKLSVRKSARRVGPENVPAQEKVRDGHPYFVSPGKGERRVFTNDRKERAVDCWLNEFEGGSISDCAEEINLNAQTLIDRVDMYRRGRRRHALHTTEPSGRGVS
ncbi:MAG: hypothetical protein OXF02_02330 [Simkaniaceae bacterium]|nr:hypothetical protein [Simkaniaceae bacterium]